VAAVSQVAWDWLPDDPTAGELTPDEKRSLVRRLADTVGSSVSAKVQDALDAGRAMSDEAEKVASSTEIQRAIRAENEVRLRAGLETFSDAAHQGIHDAVMAYVYGLGELDELLNNEQIEQINANGPFDVFATFVGGVKVRCPPIASTWDEFMDLIRRAARRLGHIEVEFDARHPWLDLPLPDGSRLFALLGGPGTNGVGVQTYLCIRRHRFPAPTRTDFVNLGLWPAEVGDFLIEAFGAGENLVVGGDWNAGKTTVLRGLCLEAIGRHERVFTVEAGITELGLSRSGRFDDVVETFSRPPGAEGEGEVTVADLIKRGSRRASPGRGIVGEVLGDEVGALLDMFTASTRGSACTIHARSARGVLRRFEYYGRQANPPLDSELVRIGLADAAPIIIHLAGDESVEGEIRRYCTSVLEVTGMEDGQVSATELWGLDDSGRLVPKHALSQEKRARLARRGWEWARDGWASRLPTEPGDLT
jgi:pilus assembly protein CpaF